MPSPIASPTLPTLSAVPSRTTAAKKRSTPPAVTEYLLSHLIALPFADFARLLARLLGEMGYEDVQLMGATHGRNHHGGLDLQASLASGLSRSIVIAQVKQYREPVPRAYVDELRGAMLRLGAQQALLFTTSTFAPAALEATQAGQHSAPIRLVDGAQLVELLLTHGLIAAEGLPATTSQATARSNPQRTIVSERTCAEGAARPPACGQKPPVAGPMLEPGGILHVAVQVTFLPPSDTALPTPLPTSPRPRNLRPPTVAHRRRS